MRAIRVMLILLVLGACVPIGDISPLLMNKPITSVEIRAQGGIVDAYEVVLVLRPQWLSRMGMSNRGLVEPFVYIDDQACRGGIKGLRSINASMIWEIRYLDRFEAPFQFGVGREYPAGVIWVITVYS